jgi:predicted DNA-binding transcriptional regulator YafY
MKSATRPQYHRLRRILEMIRQGARTSLPPNCGHFMRELEVSRRTVMRDLDFLRDDHNAPIAYDDSRKGFALTDPTFKLAPVELTRREVFSFFELVPAGPQHGRRAHGDPGPLPVLLDQWNRAALRASGWV